MDKKITLTLIIVPIFAAFFVLYATRFNIGVSPDSTSYISAAESLIKSGELRSIKDGSHWAYMTHYPPGYSIILSGIYFVTNDFYEAARYINVISIFLLLLFIGIITKKYLSTLYIIILQLFLLTNLSIFTIYEMAWTEPLYIFLSFIGLYSLFLFIQNNKIKWLIISASIICISVSIRYLGVTLILTSAIYLWIGLSKQKPLNRLKYILLHGIISSLAFIYWVARNILLENKSTNREFSFHPMTLDYYQDLLNFSSNFIITKISSNSLSLIAGSLILLAIIFYSFLVIKKHFTEFKSLLLIYPLSYLLFLFISNTFLDFTPLYYRILSPIFICIIISMFIHFFNREKKLFKSGTIILLLLLFFHSKQFLAHINHVKDGKQYSSKRYMIPSTIEALNNIPNDAKIYTNGVDRIYYLTKGRATDWVITLNQDMKINYYIVYFKKGRIIDKTKLHSESHSAKTIVNTEDILINYYSKK